MSQTIEQVQALCAAYFNTHPEAAKTTIYWLERSQGLPMGIARIGGRAIGVDAQSMPRRKDEYMQQIFTLDLQEMPLLAAQLPGSRALALFVAQPDENQAYTPYNKWAQVLCLSEADLAKGEFQADDYQPYTEGVAMRVQEITVPTAAFQPSADDADLQVLHKALLNAPARVLGTPIWIQDAQGEGTCLMQFDAKFAEINLGDMGVMYVFADTAFWQCY